MIDASFLNDHWPLTGVSVASSASSYSSREVLTVTADQGTFAAKVDLAPYSEADAARPTQVLAFLNDVGFEHAPKLLLTREGAPLIYEEGRSVCLLEHIPYVLVDAGTTTPETWHGVGQAAARLNAIRHCSFEYGIPTSAAIAELRERVADLDLATDYRRILAELGSFVDGDRIGLIHAELNEANMGMREDGSIVFLDWDSAGTGPTCLEYGYPLVMNFVSKDDAAFDVACAGAFYTGYADAGGKVDRDRAFRAGLFHALRYLFPPSGDVEEIARRWRRVVSASERRTELLSVMP